MTHTQKSKNYEELSRLENCDFEGDFKIIILKKNNKRTNYFPFVIFKGQGVFLIVSIQMPFVDYKEGNVKLIIQGESHGDCLLYAPGLTQQNLQLVVNFQGKDYVSQKIEVSKDSSKFLVSNFRYPSGLSNVLKDEVTISVVNDGKAIVTGTLHGCSKATALAKKIIKQEGNLTIIGTYIQYFITLMMCKMTVDNHSQYEIFHYLNQLVASPSKLVTPPLEYFPELLIQEESLKRKAESDLERDGYKSLKYSGTFYTQDTLTDNNSLPQITEEPTIELETLLNGNWA